MSIATGTNLYVVLTGQGNNYTAVISPAPNPTMPIQTVALNGNSIAAT